MGVQVLLQTTIPYVSDDWHVGRFGLLRDHLASIAGIDVTARDRQPDSSGVDPVLAQVDGSPFDELWLLAVDVGDGLSKEETAAINRFQRRGGGLLTTRDHQDLGSCLCGIDRPGAAHYFHSRNPDPDPERRARDDAETSTISWPNYCSGRNGDYQRIEASEPVHPLLLAPALSGGLVRRLPAHPHEGDVGVPRDETAARVIARGRSQATGRQFNLAVAFETRGEFGRAVAESSFHHFADYNWRLESGCPSFVTEPPGSGYQKEPAALLDVEAYVGNLVHWLAGIDTDGSERPVA